MSFVCRVICLESVSNAADNNHRIELLPYGHPRAATAAGHPAYATERVRKRRQKSDKLDPNFRHQSQVPEEESMRQAVLAEIARVVVAC